MSDGMSTKRERNLLALIEHSFDAIALINPLGKVLYASPATKQVLGYAPEEFIGMNGFKLVHPRDLPYVMASLAKILLKTGATARVEVEVKRKDGSWIWVEVIGTNLLSDPDVEAIVANFRDITERKDAEEVRYQLAAIVLSSNDAIIGNTPDGMITSWNSGAERIFGYRAEEIIGRPVKLLFPPERQDECATIMQQINKGKRIDHFETLRVQRDGHIFPISVTISPIKDRAGQITGASTIARDITEVYEAQQRKDEFIGMVSHELKTPVTSLKGFTHILQRTLEKEGSTKPLQYVARMDAQLNKLTLLINDLLEISRIQAGKLAFQEGLFLLDELVQNTVETMQVTSKTHMLRMEGKTQAQVKGDRDRIEQVLINLLTNAMKYSPNAETVMVRISADQQQVTVSVQDFGVGIAQAHQKKIFERFYQVIEPGEKPFSGLGIGLYISHEIIKQHRGKLWVESKKGNGATFSFTLPIAREQ